MKTKAVILLSGGLDSTTVLAMIKALDYEVYALSFNYMQRHKIELEFAKKIAQKFAVHDHKIAQIDLRMFGNSALTSDDIKVPKDQQENTEIPITYVPARNTIFLSFALAYAETIGAFDIFIGANAIDYSGYPDCRPEYIEAFENMANLATKASINNEGKFKIHTPLINLTKPEIIKEGLKLNVDYNMTLSCYDPDINGQACNHCDACLIREKAFRNLEAR